MVYAQPPASDVGHLHHSEAPSSSSSFQSAPGTSPSIKKRILT